MEKETKSTVRLFGVQAAILALCLSSCAPSVLRNTTKKLPPLDESAEVIVYDRGDAVPERSEVLGGIAFTRKGSWEDVLETAKKEARAVGGNALEIQLHAYKLNFQQISAFILNVNDNIHPTKPATFNKMNFDDYVVMKEGDTLPCSIVAEFKGQLQFVHGYNRQGYRKALSLPQSDLLSYHIEDPSTIEEVMNKNYISSTMQLAINGGYSFFYDLPNNLYSMGFMGSGEVRFLIKKGFTVGAYYSYFSGKGSSTVYWQSNSYYYPSFGYSTIHFHQKAQFFACSFGRILPMISNRQKLNILLDGGYEIKPSTLKFRMTSNVLLGYLHFTEEGEYDGDPYTLSGGAFGFGCYLGFEYMFTKHFGIGFNEGFIMGFPFKAKGNGSESITSLRDIAPMQMDLSAGLRYYF